MQSTLIPTFHLDQKYLFNLVAILGTTITPYLFFWQASEEVEEETDEGKENRNPAQRRFQSRVEMDAR